MATTTIAARPSPARIAHGRRAVWAWLTTTDHKVIGKLYLVTSFTMFLLAGLEAMLMRWQLRAPNQHFLNAEQYNQLFTMHGTTMIFMVILPLSTAFFNFVVPLQIGARDVAFPRLNGFSYWVYLAGSLFINSSWLIRAAPNGGWFAYAPLSTTTYSPGLNMDFYVLGLQALGVSTIASAINFITTIINMRAPGMHLMRIPIFTWSALVTQFLIILAFPVLTIALVFLLFDRFFGTTFYEVAAGADPLLWQHLFWIFGHPEVYILVLPAFGLVSEVLPTFSRKPLFGYPVMVYSLILIAGLAYGVWGHHMFAVGMGPIADTMYAITTMLIAIPTGVKIFNWIFTMWGGSVRFTTPALFGIGLVAMFTIGGISGVMHSSPPADLQQTDTYFVVAHFHYVLFGGSLLGILAGMYYYYPKMYGRLLDERLGKWHFWLVLIGLNLTFFPMHFLGLTGMPRRVYTYDAHEGWDTFNAMATVGAFIIAVGMLLFTFNLVRSRRSGIPAGSDPWGAGTLEWSIPSPPPQYNFAHIPRVRSRYPMWGVTSRADDQDVPQGAGEERRGSAAALGATPATPAVPREADGVPRAPAPVEAAHPTAEALGIVMPDSTILPLLAALCFMIPFVGLLVRNVPVAIAGGIAFATTLCVWLTTPLETHAH